MREISYESSFEYELDREHGESQERVVLPFAQASIEDKHF
jgi:hypothetical protein